MSQVPRGQNYIFPVSRYTEDPENSFVSLGLKVTNRCNQSCVHCCAYGEKEDMLPEHISPIAGRIGESGIIRVGVTGGEPLVYKHLPELLSEMGKYGVHLTLYTNGTLIDRPTARSVKGSVDDVKVSLLGKKETHERVTRNPESFARTLKGIENLLSIDVPVAVQFVAMEDNLGDMPYITDLCGSLGICRLNVYTLIEQGRGKDIRIKGKAPVNGEVRKAFFEAKGALEGTGRRLNMRLVEWPKRGQYVMIMPNGDVTANPLDTDDGSNFFRFGNILRDSMDELWEAYPFKDDHKSFYLERED